MTTQISNIPKPSLADKSEIIHRWLIDNGCKIDHKLIKIVYLEKDHLYENSNNNNNKTTNNENNNNENNSKRLNKTIISGLGIISNKDLKVNNIVAKIPKDIILSIHTSSISNILTKYTMERNIATAIALIYEASIGEKSKWYGYISSLPLKVDIPILWDKESQQLLNGTVMEDVIQDDNILINHAYADIVESLLIKNHPEYFSKEIFSFENFKIANSIVSSRAFCIDSYHGDSLVPLADIFNHKTGRENVHIESNGDVCNKCGSIKTCKHRKVTPLITKSAKSYKKLTNKKKMELIEKQKQQQINDEENCGDIAEEDDEHLYIKVVKAVKANQEVYNTYGDHSNATLLSKYGFIEMDNPCDNLPVEKSLVDTNLISLCKENGFDSNELSKRISFYASLFDIDSRNTHSIEISGRLDDALVCSVGIALAPLSEFEGWLKMSEHKLEKYFEKLEAEDIVKQNAQVKKAIVQILNNKLSNYPTTLEQDQNKLKELKENEENRKIISTSLNICEKKLIYKSIKYYEDLK
ncbi:hypothetical protein DICPUDRAFT_152307 [Dictyostelium purpureum]|uniref:N-lysine methyltransferase n=1 Tax=Dictyostelium purpureum TaxID=5786 RepID=F0ZL09_DICPU|nr:uncharacterized protein DICPUDRAFT_152307 [Dictyostelium purpureum]EGC35358.1 hypothetical protein DICPUDRAFT_152307 [Dictyostelium purpureum]|eukprot:XP_003288096.1 hypothetical protein DICPUDRAFT_152307 [Dictyostelium purpureum]